jgi:hypothetical protein
MAVPPYPRVLPVGFDEQADRDTPLGVRQGPESGLQCLPVKYYEAAPSHLEHPGPRVEAHALVSTYPGRQPNVRPAEVAHVHGPAAGQFPANIREGERTGPSAGRLVGGPVGPRQEAVRVERGKPDARHG